MRFVPFALPSSAFEARVERLRWDFRKWDTHVAGRPTTARGAIVLSRREHEELVRASETLFALAQDALARWPHDDATRSLGVPSALRPLAGAPSTARVTRIDWFLTADGWRASEWNDDAPGGYNDALGLVALFADAVEKGLAVEGDLPDALLRVLVPPGARRVGFAYATAYAEDMQVARLLADLVETTGAEATLASPAHLRHEGGRTTLADDEVDVVHRFFPAEWFPALENLGDWRAAIEAGLRVVNPLGCAWTQSKASFALLAGDARAGGHLPATRLLTRENAADALAQRDRLVLKPCFGRMGEGVVIGALRSADEWRKAIDGALRRASPSVLQERFLPLPLERAPGDTATPCIGAYVIDGRFAGYYGRLASRGVVRHDASNVLVLVEAV